MSYRDVKSHWTYKLFVENAELYLPFLEEARPRALQETKVLADLFHQFGVPRGGKVLDVACGTGRHANLLARWGYRVHGMDLSPLFVEKARQYAATEEVDAQFVVGNVLEVQRLLGAEAPFNAFLNMFTSHGYYGREGDLSLFQQLKEMAAPGAVLVILTTNRDWIVGNFQAVGLVRAGPYRILQHRRLDLETSTIYNTWEFLQEEGEDLKLRLRLDMDHRVYSLHELRALIEEAGWRYVRGLGSLPGEDLRLSPLTLDSKTMWVVARA